MQEVNSNVIYDEFFSNREIEELENSPSRWERFASSVEDLFSLPSKPDFCVQRRDAEQAITQFALRTLSWSQYFYENTKYSLQRVLMTFLHPAQSRLARLLSRCHFSWFPNDIYEEHVDQQRVHQAHQLKEAGFIVRHVTLEKNHITYSGLLIGHKDTILNGRWALQAIGCFGCVENESEFYANDLYRPTGFNTLLINGPGVGRSTGEATPTTMADAYEVGMTFLETAVKANELVVAGYSLGGASIGQAILRHEFKKDTRYLVVRLMTFDRASNVCAKFLNLVSLEWLIRYVICWAGCEMDSVEASRKLKEHNIQEIIVQTGKKPSAQENFEFEHDGVIHHEASLAQALVQEGVHEGKYIITVDCGHQDPRALLSIQSHIIEFFDAPSPKKAPPPMVLC